MTAARNQWLAALSKLVNPTDPSSAAKGFVAYIPLLTDFPDAAFTRDSLETVARACKRTPSYAELREALGAWWKDQRPRVTALPAPDTTPHASETRTAEEIAYVEELVKAFTAERAESLSAKRPAVEAKPLYPDVLAALRDANPLVQQARKFQQEKQA